MKSKSGSMYKNLTQTIYDLILVNTDRIHVYEKAIGRLRDEDADLKVFFTTMVSNGHQYKLALAKELPAPFIDRNIQQNDKNNFFLLWMNAKAAFADNDRKTILTRCRNAENSIQKAYETALRQTNLTPHMHTLIAAQMQSLKSCYNTISLLCDSRVHIMTMVYV
jgi:uncharacterized protein (TIGR02284 family)